MPRFHFNVRDGQDLPDAEGTELPSLEAARHEALRYAGSLLSDMGQAFWEGEPWCMEVTDAWGLELFRLDFSGRSAPALAA